MIHVNHAVVRFGTSLNGCLNLLHRLLALSPVFFDSVNERTRRILLSQHGAAVSSPHTRLRFTAGVARSAGGRRAQHPSPTGASGHDPGHVRSRPAVVSGHESAPVDCDPPLTWHRGAVISERSLLVSYWHRSDRGARVVLAAGDLVERRTVDCCGKRLPAGWKGSADGTRYVPMRPSVPMCRPAQLCCPMPARCLAAPFPRFSDKHGAGARRRRRRSQAGPGRVGAQRSAPILTQRRPIVARRCATVASPSPQPSRPRHYFIMLVYAVKLCHPDGHYPFKTMRREGGRRGAGRPRCRQRGALLVDTAGSAINCGFRRVWENRPRHRPATFVPGQDMKGANLLRLGLKTVVRRVVPVVLVCVPARSHNFSLICV